MIYVNIHFTCISVYQPLLEVFIIFSVYIPKQPLKLCDTYQMLHLSILNPVQTCLIQKQWLFGIGEFIWVLHQDGLGGL